MIGLPRAENISNHGSGQRKDTTSSNTLKDTSSDQHLDVDSKRGDERANEEDKDGEQYDGFASKDITDFVPEWGSGWICCGQSHSRRLPKEGGITYPPQEANRTILSMYSPPQRRQRLQQ